MDSHNLATLFGPNILHKAKGGAFQVETQERAEERVEVIQVVKQIIDHQHDIFAVRTTINILHFTFWNTMYLLLRATAGML